MEKIKIIDLYFQGIKQSIGAFLVETSEGPVLVETGPHSTIKNLKKGIENLGFRMEDIRHVFLTHIHLDHAGAAWCFAPHGATIYLHPLGAAHMADPSRLLASAKRIYQDTMDSLWGELHPIPENQLQIVSHEEQIQIGKTNIKAWHTPGHAIHHIAWQIGDELFAGDVAGVRIGKGMVVPPCPPPDINLDDWQASIKLIRNLNLKGIYLTHFGRITDIDSHLDELEWGLWDWANWIKPYYKQQVPLDEIVPEFTAYTANQLKERGISEEALAQYEAANPSWMSVAGLMRFWKKQEAKALD